MVRHPQLAQISSLIRSVSRKSKMVDDGDYHVISQNSTVESGFELWDFWNLSNL